MLQKYSVLIGMLVAMALLVIAAYVYPGGSIFDKNSVGFDWSQNFISHLFGAKALNGADNPARPWAAVGMIFLSASFAMFFVRFSKRIPQKSAANVVKYMGAIGMVFTCLIATPFHDIMVTIASTMFLVSIFYITVFVWRSKLHFFKFLCTSCLLIFYVTLYLFGWGDERWLPTMQKVAYFSMLLLVLGLEHFTQKEDFTM